MQAVPQLASMHNHCRTDDFIGLLIRWLTSALIWDICGSSPRRRRLVLGRARYPGLHWSCPADLEDCETSPGLGRVVQAERAFANAWNGFAFQLQRMSPPHLVAITG